MSTRATYQFIEAGNTTTLYVHHDGYEHGAAWKFQAMIESIHAEAFAQVDEPDAAYPFHTHAHARAAQGHWFMHFIRGNSGAMLTDSHESHGDTEFRYTLLYRDRVLTLTAEARYDFTDRWDTIYTGNPCGFVNKHLDKCEVTYLTSRHGHTEYMTCAQWLDKASALASLADRYKPDNCNKEICLTEAQAILNLLTVTPDELAEMRATA